MILQKHLVISKSGSAKITKGMPSLEWDELAIRLNIEIPDELFRRPQLQATIKIPKEAAVVTPINSEVTNNIQSIIKQHAGIDLKISVIPHDEATKKK